MNEIMIKNSESAILKLETDLRKLKATEILQAINS